MPWMEERSGGGFDQVAAAEQVSRPLLPAPVKGQRSRHSGEGAAPGCGGAAVEQAGGTEDERARADRGDTKRIEAHGRRTSRHPGAALPRRGRRQAIVTSQGGVSAKPCRATAARPPARVTGPGMHDRDCLDRRRNAQPSRRRRSFRPRRSALHRVIEHDAEAGRFVTFAHSRLSQDAVAAMRRDGTPKLAPRRR
jgi:hypothetical protein